MVRAGARGLHGVGSLSLRSPQRPGRDVPRPRGAVLAAARRGHARPAERLAPHAGRRHRHRSDPRVHRVAAAPDPALPPAPRARFRSAAAPVWVDDEHFNDPLPRPAHEPAAAGRRAAAEAARGAHRLAAARSREAALGDLGRRGARGRRALRDRREDPPLRWSTASRASTSWPSSCAGARRGRREPAPPTWMPRPAPSRLRALPRRVAPPAARAARRCGARAARAVARRGARRPALGRASRAVVETLAAAAATPASRDAAQPSASARTGASTGSTMDLADVKRVKDRLGGTVNDVVLATVAGALRRFLERRRVERRRARHPRERPGERARGGGARHARQPHRALDDGAPGRRARSACGASRACARPRRASSESSRRSAREVLAAVSEWTSRTLLSLAVRCQHALAAVTTSSSPTCPARRSRSTCSAPTLAECYPMREPAREPGRSASRSSATPAALLGLHGGSGAGPGPRDVPRARAVRLLGAGARRRGSLRSAPTRPGRPSCAACARLLRGGPGARGRRRSSRGSPRRCAR